MSRKSLWSILALGGILVVVAVSLSSGYSLAGIVCDAETGDPIAGAAVSAGGRSVRTDAEGSFDLQTLRGIPLLRVEAAGYRTGRSLRPLAALLGAREGLALRLAPTQLCGTVRDAATRAPLAGATVQVGERVLQTDAEGRYCARRVLPGAAITARARHYGAAAEFLYNGQAVQDIALDLLPTTVAVQDACSGQSLAGATVHAGGEVVRCDAQGLATIARLQPGAELRATCTGYVEASGRAMPGETTTVGLRPRVLRGTVTGQDGQPLAGALVVASAPGRSPSLAYTDESGAYRIECAPPDATLAVRLAGYRRPERRLSGEREMGFQLEPFAARGIYLASHFLLPMFHEQLQANLALLGRGELNAVVIEIKTEDGYLCFQPRLPLAQEIGAGLENVIDVRQLLADLRQRGIYTIARIPVFEDDLLATKRPEWAIHRSDGSVWRAAGGRGWTDPFRQEVWDYNIGIAREVVALGFDEVQFDYVRFPSDGAVGDCRYSCESTPESRVGAITGFLAQARKELDTLGAFLSADLFGLTTFSDDEVGIGQLIGPAAAQLDYVSPMVYPSTYSPGMLGLADPWRSPYEVIKLSLAEARQRTSTLIRPWLQHYDDYNGTGFAYGLRELELQKQAAVEEQAHGWLFWNVGGVYEPRLFEP